MNIADFHKPVEHLQQELRSIRAGRATPDLVTEIKVEAYGQLMTVKELASVTAPDRITIQIQPWDKSVGKAIAHGITTSSLGVQPTIDGDIIRVHLPKLTEEQRHDYVKLINKKTEEAKVGLRRIREESIKQLKAQEKDGTISEDMCAREVKKVQEQLDATVAEAEALVAAKTQEVMTV